MTIFMHSCRVCDYSTSTGSNSISGAWTMIEEMWLSMSDGACESRERQ